MRITNDANYEWYKLWVMQIMSDYKNFFNEQCNLGLNLRLIMKHVRIYTQYKQSIYIPP